MGYWSKQALLVCACLFAFTGQSFADSLSKALHAYDAGNYAKAAKLLKPLAAKGDAEAQFKLATLYYRGKGVKKNLRNAEKYYRLSAEKGHVVAQSNLATMYYTGTGVRKDFVLAHMWKYLAARNAEGDRKLRYFAQLKDLERDMKAQQISEANKLASKCAARKFKRCARTR